MNNQTRHGRPPFWAPKPVQISNVTIIANTSTIAPDDSDAKLEERQVAGITSCKSTFLVIARDASSAYSAKSGLNDYGIPFEVLIVPAGGVALPPLSSATGVGNYGGFVILSEVSYADSAGNYASALTSAQWNTLYTYQRTFGARMVRLDVVPSAATGTTVVGSCCDGTLEQWMAISDQSQFPTAGIVVGAGLSTKGLYHYPASISNSTLAKAFALFGTTTGFTSNTVAGVINNFGNGRQQMVFFLGFATDWSTTSIILQHAWIHWATRGLYAGYRRVMLNTQIDDMFLTSPIYSGGTFRVEPADLAPHITWMAAVRAKLPTGSNWTMEVGHNGNGNIGVCRPTCGSGPIDYAAQPDPTAAQLEYVKPPGTGTSLWPATASTYPYSLACVTLDPLLNWWAKPAYRDAFMHISHTFTHEAQDAATYSDVMKEISWNQAWIAQWGLSGAKWFSGRGLIPPAITGLHNGDALKAWSENGLVNAVGDNTRPVLLNAVNEHWPLITTMAADNFDGIQITPRWATNIYYNCDTTACDVAEWKAIAQGSGTILDLLALEQSTNVRHLLALHHDAFMFHQANLRQADVATTTLGQGLTAKSGKWSLFQMWVEIVLGELMRVVTWPIISLKHDDIATAFAQRMARDNCNYTMTYTLDSVAQTITSITLSNPGNTCAAPIPITVPGPVKSTRRFTTEQLGGDPLTIWVPLVGAAEAFDLKTPVAW
ncbi:uncharacterized protein LY89DRAFT_599894 [Mollisia scopiformis]|uniref:Extracellular serine-rich protein n=1 Tax=Mollisia scopiformis TaxID=149040 RepID=A0A132B729_MOLSC|nr:uncharacterized protein LY89DRAFT_599894 [Mollisia scopiformis]KUJ08212.1 hypothetical protein LY89DRAFT_599894 [Mollisia scopiformis]